MNKKKAIKRFVRIKRKKLINSFKYAICGLKSAYKREQNLKVHIMIMIIVIIAGIVLKIDKMEWIICIILFAIVIGTELMNTAIEAIVDMVMPEINAKAKFIKDVSASSVLVFAMGSAIIGLIIFIPKIISIIV